jgi:hypothetical protein
VTHMLVAHPEQHDPSAKGAARARGPPLRWHRFARYRGSGRRGSKRRLAHNFAFKHRALTLFTLVTEEGAETPRQTVANFLEINPSLITKWQKQGPLIEWMALHGHGHRSRASVKTPQFPEVEDYLYMKFFYRRMYQGLVVRDAWIRREFKRCLAES